MVNPCGWPPTHRIGAIHWIDTLGVGGANWTPRWWCLWGELCWCLTDYSYYSYSRKSKGREFFVPVRTLIGIKLLRKDFELITLKFTIAYVGLRATQVRLKFPSINPEVGNDCMGWVPTKIIPNPPRTELGIHRRTFLHQAKNLVTQTLKKSYESFVPSQV